MTTDKDFKKVVRERAAKTGESYTTARHQLEGDSSPAALTVLRDQLVATIQYFWTTFRPGLRGLTDDEYRWEPVPGCPTVRPGDSGGYRADNQFPPAGAASIAQRLCWSAQLLLVDTNQHFGDKSVVWSDVAEVPGEATGGVAFVDSAVTAWQEAIAACEPSRLLEHSENRSPGAIDHEFPLMTSIVFKYQLLVQCCAQVSMTREVYLAAHPDIVGPR
jgi:hypothetical protein